MIKLSNSQIENMYRTRYGEKAWSPLSPNLHVLTNWEAPWTLSLGVYGGFSTQAWLNNSLAMGDWAQSWVALPCPEGKGVGLKVPTSNHSVGSTGCLLPSLGAFQRSITPHGRPLCQEEPRATSSGSSFGPGYFSKKGEIGHDWHLYISNRCRL